VLEEVRIRVLGNAEALEFWELWWDEQLRRYRSFYRRDREAGLRAEAAELGLGVEDEDAGLGGVLRLEEHPAGP
jgi:hypothetical protein